MAIVSALSILITMASVIAYEFYEKSSSLVLLAGVSLVFFIIIQLKHINRVGKLLLIMSLVSSVLLFLLNNPLITLENAMLRASFFAAFLTALAFIRLAAQRSLIVQRCGYLVVDQPPSRRYGIITIASFFFANVLNFGVLHLLGMMIEKGNTIEAAKGIERIKDLRRKRMSLALLRGFALLPLASPFSIAFTLMLANMPQLNWVPLIAMGGIGALLLFIIGWIMDYYLNPIPSDSIMYTEPSSKQTLVKFSASYPFIGIIIGVFLLSISIEKFAGVSLSVAILSVFPIVGLIWFLIEHYFESKKNPFDQLFLDLPVVINSLRSEIAIISGACFFGVVFSDTIPNSLVLQILSSLNLSELMLSLSLCILVASVSHFGISPFISATFLASSLAPLLVGQYSPEMIALGIMSGWSLATSGSPVSISTLIVSSIIGKKAQLIAYSWNISYTLISFIVLSLWIFVLSL